LGKVERIECDLDFRVVKMFSHRDGGKIDETFDEDSRNLADIRREKSSKTWNKLP
jgi:hypothetical protein